MFKLITRAIILGVLCFVALIAWVVFSSSKRASPVRSPTAPAIPVPAPVPSAPPPKTPVPPAPVVPDLPSVGLQADASAAEADLASARPSTTWR